MDPDKDYFDSDYYDSEEEEEEELEGEEVGQPAVAAAVVGFGHLVIVRATQPRRARVLRWVLPQCLGVMDEEEREGDYLRVVHQRGLPTWVDWTEMPVVVRGKGEGVKKQEEEEEEEEDEEEDRKEDYEDEGQHDHGARQRMVIVSVAGGDVCVVGPGGEEWEMVAGDCT